MPFGTQFSFTLELAKILPVRSVVTYTTDTLVQLVRSLKASGSDFLIEEDLASIFGRGMIVPAFEDSFRAAVKIDSVFPLYNESEILLNASPGPTVRRALKDRYYMASIIQLSLLTWSHEKRSLAEALVECMRIRCEEQLPGSAPQPGYADILRTLEVCSSQTSHFHWDAIVMGVKQRLERSYQFFECELQVDQCNAAMYLPVHILLGAIDYFYMVQRFPEDRFIMVDRPRGMIPLTIWAHFILGLSVLVEGTPDGNVTFGDCHRPQVIIKWNVKDFPGIQWSNSQVDDQYPQAMYLLDSHREVLLQSHRIDNKIVRIDGQERHRLHGYGSAFLQRQYCKTQFVANDSPLYSETANFAVSYAIAFSRRILHPLLFAVRRPEPTMPKQHHHDIEIWRLYQSAEMLFAGLRLDKQRISDALQDMNGMKLVDIPLPSAIRVWIDTNQDDELPKNRPRDFIFQLVRELSSLVLIFSRVEDLEKCTDLPLLIESSLSSTVSAMFQDTLDDVPIEHNIWMRLIVRLLDSAAEDDHSSEPDTTFLESRNGWSVFYASVGDHDPGRVNCDLICIRPGVPTSSKTDERKRRIVDAPGVYSNEPKPKGLSNNKHVYSPRSAVKISRRVEHWTSKENEFCLSIRFDVEETEPRGPKPVGSLQNFPHYSLYASYGRFHAALWRTVKTKQCPHPGRVVAPVPLDIDARTYIGLQMTPALEEGRIHILLVRDNPRARWLVVQSLLGREYHFNRSSREPPRQVMLRCVSCCDDCAVKAAAALSGDWLVIL